LLWMMVCVLLSVRVAVLLALAASQRFLSK
jgi:hypothetical protein